MNNLLILERPFSFFRWHHLPLARDEFLDLKEKSADETARIMLTTLAKENDDATLLIVNQTCRRFYCMDEKEQIRQLDHEKTISTGLRLELEQVHHELHKTNSELMQLTLELDDRVEERTRELQKSEQALREHRDHLQEMVQARTASLEKVNATLARNMKALEASEEQFRSLVATIPDIVYRIDSRGRFTFINDAVEKLGYTPDELIGEHFEK